MSRISFGTTAALVLLVAAGCGGGGDDGDGNVATVAEDAAVAPGDVTDDADGADQPQAGSPEGGDSPFDVAAGPEGDAGPGTDEVPGDIGPDDGPEDQAPVGTGEDTATIAGFWDYTREVPEGTDVAFFDISETGTITEYDFQGDDAGDGRDCHTTFTAAIASNGEGRYDIQDASSLPGASSIDDVRIAVEGGALVFRYIGDAFDPEFGEGMAGITETYPAAGVSPTDLSVCP